MEKKKRRKWTIEEDNYLIANYSDAPIEKLLSDLDRTYYGLMGRIKHLGLKRSKEYLQSLVTESMLEKGKKTRFKKGGKSWNKGTKGLTSGTKGSFKKHHKPHNLKPIGSERVRKNGYIEIKYKNEYGAKSNYALKHRVVWSEFNGPIPKGYVVSFKDGDVSNCDIDNLFLLSKQDNILENSFSDTTIAKKYLNTDNISDEKILPLIRLKRIELKLKQKLREYESK